MRYLGFSAAAGGGERKERGMLLLWLGREEAFFSICSAYFTASKDVVMI